MIRDTSMDTLTWMGRSITYEFAALRVAGGLSPWMDRPLSEAEQQKWQDYLRK